MINPPQTKFDPSHARALSSKKARVSVTDEKHYHVRPLLSPQFFHKRLRQARPEALSGSRVKIMFRQSRKVSANFLIKQWDEYEPFKPLVKTDSDSVGRAANNPTADAFNVQAAMVALENDVQRTADTHWQGTFQDSIAPGYAHVLQTPRNDKIPPDCPTQKWRDKRQTIRRPSFLKW
jgi:hypothetical protein